jgi:AcrR family transcriptional regulator
MADIAGEAGYSAPTLYNYFDNKDAIIVALNHQVMDEYQALFDAPVPAGLDFAQKLELLTLRQTDFARRRHDAFVVMMSNPPGGSGRKLHADMQREFGAMMNRWADWIRAAATPAELRGHDPIDLAFLLWGIQHAVMIRAFLHGDAERRTAADEARSILDFFFHGLSGPDPARSDL